MDDSGDEASDADAEFMSWHVYHAGGPRLRLKVRFRDDVEVTDWRNGPDLFDAFEWADADGWYAYDREPSNEPGEYSIYHLKRMPPPHETPR